MNYPSDLSAHPHIDSNSRRVRRQQLSMVFGRLPALIVVGALGSSAVITAVLWDVASIRELTLWLAAHFGIVATLKFVHLRHRFFLTESQYRRASLALNSTLAALGVFWAALLVYACVITPSYGFHFYVFMFTGCLGVLAVALFADDIRCYLAFTPPPFLAVSAFALASGESRRVGLGLIGLLCGALLYLLARARERSTAEALRLRFEVADLAEELREQRDEAQRAGLAKSKLFAAASHDLRQPVHALTLLTAALHNMPLDARTRSVADDIGKAVGSLERLFDSLLDVSRLDAGVVSPRLHHFDVDELVGRLIGELQPEAKRIGLRLGYDLCRAVVRSDPLLLERILRNYLANALRYTKHGRIDVKSRFEEAHLRIDVVDTGIGISADQHAAIFDEFHQIDNPERDRSMGLGLGLAIVRRIADMLEHPYGVESELGRGARFFICVPIGSREEVTTDEDPNQVVPGTVHGIHVVVVDDDQAVREGTRSLLSTWGCNVLVASGGTEAIHLIRDSRIQPDALLVDYRLRKHETGADVVAAIRRECGRDVPALILSGDTAPERLLEVAASGLTMIHKPVQPALLRSFLAHAQRGRRSAVAISD